MGIYGLTSYVSQHQSELLDDCKLHNCPVLVDGNSAASMIYSNVARSNYAFGGDYDRYAHSTRNFVQLLRKCDLTPIFIFDGGYERRKLKTVLERIRMNIIICGQYKNKYRECKTFPLMMRDIFRAVLNELRVTMVQCDFEADNELVVLSRILRCPLISYDSDFCVTDARYIPFTTIDFRAVKLKKKSTRPKYYLSCKMFNVDKFLDRFGGPVDKSLLPLLSCALGNDYIPRNTFRHFLQLDHMTSFDERVTKIVQWMANIVTVDEAVDQMVASVRDHKLSMKNKIDRILYDYNRTSSYLLDFIPQEIIETSLCHALEDVSITNSHIIPECLHESMTLPLNQSDFDISLMDAEDKECMSPPCSDDEIIILETEEYEIPCSDDEDVVELLEESQCGLDDTSTAKEQEIEAESKANEVGNCQDSVIDSIADDSLLNLTDFQTNINDNSVSAVIASETLLCFKVPEWFLHKYRLGFITPNLINVINFQRWFIPSQSEDYFSKPSHEISLPILQAVIGIVLGEITAVAQVKCHARAKGIHLGVYEIRPIFEVQAQPLPSLHNVASIPAEVRASILMDCLSLSKDINLRMFPREWRLYMLIVMYWKNQCKKPAVNESHIRTVMLCLIYLSVIDSKIGFVRLASDLKRTKKMKRRSDKLLMKTSSSSKVVSTDTVHGANSLDVTEDPLPHLLANSSKMEHSLSVNNDQTDTFSNMDVDPSTFVTDLTANPPELIGDPVPVDKCQKSTCESLPLDANLPLADADSSVVDGNLNLRVPAEDSGNELFMNKVEYDSVQDFLDLISEEDCHKSAMALLNYHQVNPTLLQNRQDFDPKLIHSFAQLQHCIQSICILNSVLDFPFMQCQPHLSFSGTFLYNFYSELSRRKLADGYITRTVLAKASTIIALYRYLISSWESVTSKKVIRPKFDVKKKKKKKSCNPLPESVSNELAEQELYYDSDNIYSILPEE